MQSKVSYFFSILGLMLLLSFSKRALATHLRAGDITASRISTTSLTYRITLTTYTDQVNGVQANDAQETVNFYFGFSTNKVETVIVSRSKKTLINTSTVCNVYETVYTFPTDGNYTISCGISNRNTNTVNLPQPSESISFFVQTTLRVNASIGINNTPVLINVPIDSAAAGVKFIHNPGAFDVDGDSLAYRLTIPKRDLGEATGFGVFIDDYLDPRTVGTPPILNEFKNGAATFTIDPITGDLIWDAPQQIGQYNVAFVIEEYRRTPNGTFIKIGEVVRDMQIIVVNTDNKRPLLTLPEDKCVPAGENINFEVTARDQDQDQEIHITSTGGVYNLDFSGNFKRFIEDPAATFKPADDQGFSSGIFDWNTSCLHVRDQPYDVLFRVIDNPGRFNTQLTDIGTVKITVAPPVPKNLKAVIEKNTVKVTWRALKSCAKANGSVEIFKKTGCNGLSTELCTQSGMPASWQYTKVGEVGLTDTVFVDTTSIDPFNVSSYRVLAVINSSRGTVLGSPSEEVCIGNEIQRGSVLITNVDIKTTDKSQGDIQLKWTRPVHADISAFKAPFSYKIFRAMGQNGTDFKEVNEINTGLLPTKNDTTWTDKSLNTEVNSYRYRVEFWDSQKVINSSLAASSVRLSASGANKSIRLSWVASVPWSNENKEHKVYRKTPSENKFTLLGGIVPSQIGEYSFTDSGTEDQPLLVDSTYCYYVTTLGEYPDFLQFGSFTNNSQISCSQPLDLSQPCGVNISSRNQFTCEEISVSDFCDKTIFNNTLSWGNGDTDGCRKDISHYNVYYARYQDEPLVVRIATVPSDVNIYRHQKNALDGFAGCYAVTAVSSLDIEGERSNVLCFDNCINLNLPNAFSPNSDGYNDTFMAMGCEAFVEHVKYQIYNSKGARVVEAESKTLSWDGKSNSGTELPGGVYYYLISFRFTQLDRSPVERVYKGSLILSR